MGSSMSSSSSISSKKKGTLKQNGIKKPVVPTPSHTSSDHSSQLSSERVMKQGRQFHNESNSAYWYPNDDQELDRLVGEHFALKTLFNGNIPEGLFEKFSIPVEDNAKILDLGCGPGTWIMDVATELPNSELVGVDISDVFPSDIRPSNVSFKLNNILDGIAFPDNTFDIVHFRFFCIALRSEEWIPVLKEIMRVLKPGGIIVSKEPGMLLEGNEFFKWAGKVFIDKMLERGQEPFAYDKINQYLSEAGFEIVHHEHKPIDFSKQDSVSKEFLWDMKGIFKSGQPYLAESLGVPNERYDAFLDRLVIEFQKPPACFWPISSTVGRKPL
ncbi:S-adenosyl-L-methionine-dependent methyltransferase [Gilbertella persicaria]|uniref:S-adenosyl-L-methionine-dependent methyltransferase n=1 Tax=Gilbertella persicaria TaxID=101096 RepID=UPI002220DDEA|nr:S-adenosyl-L-methionine-dependent methyltransferase [Gilbertella persicaria]KAI8082674.1 S-adenosyl-L-methionine-dependent methyltransferase [Gilbertella persicaria]